MDTAIVRDATSSADQVPGTPGSRHRGAHALTEADIDRTPLAGAGNYLFRVNLPATDGVLKIYEGSRSSLLYLKKTFGNVVLTGRSSHMPRARCRVEADCVRTWESHGFRCFSLYSDVTAPGLDRDVYMVFEYVPGLHFREYFRNPKTPLEEKLETWRRFVPEWHRRHRLAVETADPRLIHENGDVKHVMLYEGDFVYFDFEMVYRSKHIRHLVGLEILCYMRSVGRFFGEEMYDRMLDELVATYPDKALLFAAYEAAYAHPNLIMRVARWLDRALKPSRRARFAKYTVARDLRARLDATSLTASARRKS